MGKKTPWRLGFAFSLTAAAVLGAVVAAALEPTTTTTTSSIGAEVGPDAHHQKHAHPDHTERLNVRGTGAIMLPAAQVNASVEVRPPEDHHQQHAHEPHLERDRSAGLRGEVIVTVSGQGSLTPGTSVAL
jgi:hypothetical protein